MVLTDGRDQTELGEPKDDRGPREDRDPEEILLDKRGPDQDEGHHLGDGKLISTKLLKTSSQGKNECQQPQEKKYP